MNNYIIIHGACGSPVGNWFPWLQDRLTEKGREVLLPQFPTPDAQNYTNWSYVLEAYLKAGKINEDTVFIAHSLGPIFVCRFLIEHQIKVKGLIAVAGFNTLLGKELDAINKTFFIPNEKLAQVVNYTEFIYCFYSDNDPYITLEYLQEFATVIKAEKNLIHGAGHLNAEAGYTKFLPILEIIKQSETNMSFQEDNDMPIGINCIILNEKNEILLAKRKNRFGAGTYSLIGGKLKIGESFEGCAIRELKEELGIEVEEKDLEVINLVNQVEPKGKHFVQIGIVVKKYTGVIENKEENKCEELAFFSMDCLPELFFATKSNIELFKRNQFYATELNN